MLALKQNGLLIEYVKNHTKIFCKIAVHQNGLALKHITNRLFRLDPDICLLAVQQNGLALQYTLYQPLNVCIMAVKQNIKALDYVENNTKTFRDKLNAVLNC